MYLPPHFEETNLDAVAALMDASPLAAIIASTKDGLLANHIPLLRDGDNRLIGHIAKNNAMHEVLSDGHDVLVIFNGVDGYISPNWYPTKADHHRHVPTWNYQVVHVHGKIRFQHDDKTKRAVVGRLTKIHETRVNGADGWRMADAPADYMETMLSSIVAFDIAVSRITAKSKLSQNREKVDFDNVVDTLANAGKTELSDAMRRIAKTSGDK